MAKDAFLPAKLPEQQGRVEERAGITEGRPGGDIWSLLKPQEKEGWVIKVEEVVQFSLKRWCHMFEDLPLDLIWNKPVGKATAAKAVCHLHSTIPLLSQGCSADAGL